MHATILLGLSMAIAATLPKKAAVPLTGKWVLVSESFGGVEVANPAGSGSTLEADGTIVHNDGQKEAVTPWSYKYNAKTSPPEFEFTRADLSPDAKPYLGIYKIEGDILTICHVNGTERPTKFESPAGSEISLRVYKRFKEEK